MERSKGRLWRENDSAANIRQQHKLFAAFVRAVHECGDQSLVKRLLDQALAHERQVGSQLALARAQFDSKTQWRQWLKDRCFMDESLACRYIERADNTITPSKEE